MKVEISYSKRDGKTISRRYQYVKGILEDRGVAVSKLEVHFHNGAAAEILLLPSNMTWEQWNLQVKVLKVRENAKHSPKPD